MYNKYGAKKGVRNPITGTWEVEMTPEAIAERDRRVSSWGGSNPLPGTSFHAPQSNERVYIGQQTGEDAVDYDEPPVPLATFCDIIKNNSIVKSVYCLEDGRDPEEHEDTFVHLLVHLHPLENIGLNHLKQKNKNLTRTISMYRVAGAMEVRVSYQYTEVYRG